MKHAILNMIGSPIILMTKVLRPPKKMWHRFFLTASLKAKVRDMDFSVICDGSIRVTGTGNIHLGKRCRLGMDIELGTEEQGKITIGDDTRLNRGCTVVSYSQIDIGDFAIIGEFATIRDANHGMKLGEPMRYQPHDTRPIRIGRDVWIGRGCCILPGVSIGEGSVIGANSVCTRDIPPYSIAAGIPAKVIRKRE